MNYLWQFNTWNALDHLDHRPSIGFFHFNPRGEGILKRIDMCDDQDLFEILLYQIDGFHQSLTADLILAAESLIDNQSLQASPGALRWP